MNNKWQRLFIVADDRREKGTVRPKNFYRESVVKSVCKNYNNKANDGHFMCYVVKNTTIILQSINRESCCKKYNGKFGK